MNNELRQIIQKRLTLKLRVAGYPDITSEQILALLPELWNSVKDLIPEDSGFGYQEFAMVAQQEYVKSKIKGN